MGSTRRLVTIKRSGVDGPHFPLSLHTCLFGRSIECDIRIQLPVVSKQHCKIEINGQEAILFNFSSTNPTRVNGSTFDKPVQLKHGDVITVVDRSFRYENESHQNGSKSPAFPGQRREQEPSRRVSRSSFPSNLDGKVQDSSARSKFTEDAASGRPVVHGKNVTGAGIVSGGSEDPVAGKTPNSVHSSERPGDNGRNATAPTAGDSQEGSGVTFGISNGELKAFSSRKCLKESDQNESPFRKLYESMKVELDVKSGKVNVLQNRRKSGSQSHCTPEKESTGGLQSETLVSLKSRPKSGQSPQIKADPASGEQGSSQTEGKRSDEPFQTPKETRSPSSLCTEVETLQTTTPEPYSQQSPSRSGRSEDLSVVHGGASLNLDQSEGSRADIKTFPPRKFLPSIQTPVKVESFGNTPEKLCPGKRKRNPTNVDDLTTETEILHQTISAPLVPQVERKIQSDFLNKPEKLGMAADPVSPGLPGLSSADGSSFGDSTNKMDGVSLKRRRVSFGGRLRPELFDENLPPNTPLKRGETPKQRRSLVTHTPTVLKKIIKEQPQPSGKEDSSEVCLEATAQDAFVRPPAPNAAPASPDAPGRCRSLSKASSISSDSKSPHQTDIPKRGRRKSSNLPSKRASVDRSQHGILQMIYSKRRSGASEANLVVAKSWADVVKLGTKQTQTRAVQRGPPRPLSKRQRRTNNTPKKLTGIVHNQFSTGHANSPCTIIIGKAHIEKVNGPARPYRMLNNFVVNKPMDFSEDLSGLPEMFKTPVKEKPQRMSLCPSTFSNSEDLLGEELPVPHSGGKPLLCASENSGQNVSPGTQDAPKELSDQRSASPALRRQSIKIKIDESIMKTPRNVYKTAGAEMETPVSEAMTPKTTSSAKKLRRSMELRSSQAPGVECKNEGPKPDALENILGRCLRKAPQPEQKLEGDAKESEARTEHMGSKENSKHTIAVRGPRRASELRCELAADLAALESLQETQPEEDQRDIPSLLQTPAHAKEAVDAENRATKMLCKSPRSGTVGTPTRTNTQLKTPSWNADVEDASALGKLTQTPGKTMPMHGEPGDDKSIKLFQETPKQKPDPAENVAGSKRRPRTPKGKAPPLEDLAGFKELFQTPHHAKEPMTDDKTPKMLCQSPQLEPVNTPSRKGRLKTPSQKVDVQGDVSALRKPQQTPGETTHSHREPEGADGGIAVSREAPEEKLDPAENVTGSKRQPRTPKEKAPPLEDLVGFKELFQTPNHAVEPMSADKIFKMLCQSPQLEPINTPSRKGRLKTPSQKVDVQEDVSALRKPTQSHREPEGGDRGIVVSQEAPGEKLDPVKNVTGSKRQPRTPKEKASPLEHLAGFKELFQTPHQAKEPVTEGRTPKMLCRSPPPEPVVTSTSMTRLLKTPSQRVAVQEDLSALREPTHSHREPEGGDGGIAVSQEAPEERLDPAENVIGSKRRLRTPKEKAPPLEDLAGFKELFQTPDHAEEQMTNEKTTTIPYTSPAVEPVTRRTGRKRRFKSPPGKVDAEELSAPRKPTQTPGGARHSDRERADGDKSIKLSKETPKQKLDSAENINGSKRPPRTPKEKVQCLEDLAGFKELFQTPDHAKEPRAVVKTPQTLCMSSQPQLIVTPTNRKRWLKTPLGKADVETELSACRMTQTPGETGHSEGEPVDDDKSIKLFQETPHQKLDSSENVSGSKRRPRTPKGKAPPLEDLAGLKELFQTPDHAKEPTTDDRPTNIPRQSPQPEPANTPSRKGRLKTPSQKVDVQEDVSALRKPQQTPGETTHSHREPEGADGGIAVSREAPAEKLDPAENVTRSKRRPRTPRKTAPPLEDLAGFKELFQTPHQAKEPMTEDRTPKMLCRSPPPEPVVTSTSMTRRLKTPSQRVAVQEDLSALGKPTHSHREPEGGDGGIAVSQEAPEERLDPAENVIGSKRRLRTPKEKAPPLEDLAGFKELFQTPDHAEEQMTNEKTTTIPYTSPAVEPVTRRTGRKRRFKSPPGKVDAEELSAPRKPTQTPGGARHSDRERADGDKSIKLSKETPKQKLDSAENINGSKRPPRTPKEKVQCLEDLAGFKELFQTPDHAEEQMTNEKTTTIPYTSPAVEPVTRRTGRKRRFKSPPGKVDAEEPSAPRKPTQTPGDTQREPVCDEKDSKAFKENSRHKLVLAENVIGIKSRLRTLKEKAQPVEELCSFNEPFQKPGQAKEPVSDGKIAPVPCQSPPAGPVTRPASRKRRLKSPPEKVGVEEPSAPRKPTQTPGDMQREPVCDEKDSKVIKETSRQRLNPAENVIGIKRRLRTFKEKTQPVEDSCSFNEPFQKPGQAKEPVSDVKITAVPCQSPPAGPVTRPASRRRRLQSPLGKVALEELSVLREPIPTAGETMHREPVGDENNTKVFKETSRQNPDSAGNVICVKSRRRTFKEKSQPLEDPASFKELFQKPDQASELGNDASAVKRAPKQTADRRRPVEISRRVLRAPKVRFMGDLVGSRDPVQSPGENCISPSPKRKLGEDARVVGRKRLCPTMAAQDAEEEKPLQKKQRTAPRERREPPRPSGVKKRSLRILAQRTKPVGNLPNNDMKTKATDPQGEDTPNKGMSLRTRRPTKTNIEEQRPGSLISAGKVKIKRSEKKCMETSQEMKLQSPEDAAENPTSGGKVQDRRRPLRSGKQNQKALPDATEETARQERVEIPVKKQEEKEVTEYSDFKGLRSRKITLRPRGNTSESGSEQRVTRGARRCANSLQKENDNVGVKKIRTRSHRDSEDT
ncbi:proliferation marker protein Ki-67 isoform X1 [Tursiops truncatus]|uniref:Proliferation marker protein Ki-67 isoform X1 n=1 Tax=Tursiops truncatus TaxID=9739 RepID=A0A6J3Q6W4_TURTR|nr:proliferation marker protein Ki-67 isoform X1 [Tursiops truncatus]XP_033697993.1 proliferation marker protein Ki-67 isoform X1 [Tursiops truncatus]XP_033697994.1 proliferation marker protein Ki-67 isoform X1 [Tursiops truncatus]